MYGHVGVCYLNWTGQHQRLIHKGQYHLTSLITYHFALRIGRRCVLLCETELVRELSSVSIQCPDLTQNSNIHDDKGFVKRDPLRLKAYTQILLHEHTSLIFRVQSQPLHASWMVPMVGFCTLRARIPRRQMPALTTYERKEKTGIFVHSSCLLLVDNLVSQ